MPRLKPAPALWAKVDAEVDALDRLVAEVRAGVRNAAHYAELEERANGICTRLRAAFRNP